MVPKKNLLELILQCKKIYKAMVPYGTTGPQRVNAKDGFLNAKYGFLNAKDLSLTQKIPSTGVRLICRGEIDHLD